MAMAPKRKLSSSTEPTTSPKRSKTDSGPESSRSGTPIENPAPVLATVFQVSFGVLPQQGKSKSSSSSSQIKYDPRAESLVRPFPELQGSKKDELNRKFLVEPYTEWAAMKNYSNCLIQTRTYKTGDDVFVRHVDTSPDREHDIKEFWVGRIIQIRAKDPQNVYALVSWYSWPKDLLQCEGKKRAGALPYHGNYEMIASNDVGVVEVLSFAGHAVVSFWDESDDIITSNLYWRQTLAYSPSLKLPLLSKVKEHCTCRCPFNPESPQPMYICDDAACSLWLRKECLIQDALDRAYNDLDSRRSKGGKTVLNGQIKSSRSSASLKRNFLRGELVEVGNDMVVAITDTREDAVDIPDYPARCLKCNTDLKRE